MHYQWNADIPAVISQIATGWGSGSGSGSALGLGSSTTSPRAIASCYNITYRFNCIDSHCQPTLSLRLSLRRRFFSEMELLPGIITEEPLHVKNTTEEKMVPSVDGLILARLLLASLFIITTHANFDYKLSTRFPNTNLLLGNVALLHANLRSPRSIRSLHMSYQHAFPIPE